MDDRDIEQIVREVLRRVSEIGAVVSEPAKTTRSERPHGQGDLVLNERVVTLAAVDGRLHGVRRLVIRPNAVVTPSVKDLLRRGSIALERAEPAANDEVGSCETVTVMAETRFDPSALRGRLGGAPLRSPSVAAAVEQLASQLSGGDRLGILLTERVAPALCLANRHAGIRAAQGCCREAVRAAVQMLGANLLIVNPGECSVIELTNRLHDFTQGGPRECPSEYRSLLERVK